MLHRRYTKSASMRLITAHIGHRRADVTYLESARLTVQAIHYANRGHGAWQANSTRAVAILITHEWSGTRCETGATDPYEVSAPDARLLP